MFFIGNRFKKSIYLFLNPIVELLLFCLYMSVIPIAPLKTGDELRCSETVSSSCSTSGTRRVNLVTNPVISREWGKDREVLTTCRSLFVLLVLFVWPLWWLSFFDLRITPFDIFKLLLHLCHNGKELYLNEIMMVSAFYISNTIKM